MRERYSLILPVTSPEVNHFLSEEIEKGTMTWNQRWIKKVLLVRLLARFYNLLLIFFIVAGLSAVGCIGESKAKTQVRHVFYGLAIGSFFTSVGCALGGRLLMGSVRFAAPWSRGAERVFPNPQRAENPVQRETEQTS